jgi:hypothetical protein
VDLSHKKIDRGQRYFQKTKFQGREKGNYKIGKTGAKIIVENNSKVLSKRGLPPPTQVKFTAFHDRSRIVNVYKRIETFINVSFTTNSEKSRKLLSVGAGDLSPMV